MANDTDPQKLTAGEFRVLIVERMKNISTDIGEIKGALPKQIKDCDKRFKNIEKYVEKAKVYWAGIGAIIAFAINVVMWWLRK